MRPKAEWAIDSEPIRARGMIVKNIASRMKARSGQNHDNKIALQVSFNPTAANIMDMLCIFVITEQYFLQRVSNYF